MGVDSWIDKAGEGSRRPPRVRLSATYLLYFGALGALLPYWSPYLETLSFSPAEIGELLAVFMATRIVAPPLAGALADRLGRRIGVVRVGAWLTAGTFALAFLGDSYWWLLFVTFAFSSVWSGVLPPLEALTLSHLRGETRRYGLVRLWGSVGFIAAVIAVGQGVRAWGADAVIPLTAALFVLGAVVCLVLPDATVPVERPDSVFPWRALATPRVIALLVLTLLVQVSHGPYYTFFSIFAEDLGWASDDIGLLWALAVAAEVAAFLWLVRHLDERKAPALLVAALILTAVRWLVTGVWGHEPALLLLAQTLHAASYAMFHAVVIHYLFTLVPPSAHAFGQAAYASMSYGVGGALGSLVGGYAWETVGPTWTFGGAAALALIGVPIAWWYFIRR